MLYPGACRDGSAKLAGRRLDERRPQSKDERDDFCIRRQHVCVDRDWRGDDAPQDLCCVKATNPLCERDRPPGRDEALAAKLGCEADHPRDVQALNVMRALELEGVGVYQVAAESGLVSQDTLKVAVLFQTQHREHAQTLADAIKKIGGSPVDPKSATEYAKVVTAAGPRIEADVIALASMLEKGAASAYIGTIPLLTDPLLAQLAAKIAADEVMHFTALQGALKRPLPEKSLSFGA